MSDLISQRELDENGRPNNLPSSSTPLIGREEEVHKVAAMLLKPDCRMVTIVGIGGMGKTSLALAVGRHLEHNAGTLFAQGITFVALQSVDASTSDSEAVATAVAQTLKLQLPGRSAPSIEVIEYFEERDQLLILDNFEHLLGAAGWLGSILRRCPQIKLLVTSRELLYLGAERRFSLGGLLYPVLSDQALELTAASEDFAAIQLFLQAAREARPDFIKTAENEAAIIECCQLLMGMPLAIRLAASWLRIMSVGKLIQELRRNLDLLRTQMYDIPVRQRSMRAVIDSTWILLHRDEQQILASLSVFRGGFSVAAAEELCRATLMDLTDLRDRGLLQYDDDHNRYILHELVRQYAAEHLARSASEATATHGAHSHYYAQFLAKQIPRLLSPQLADALNEIDKDIDNIRAGWRWAVSTMDDQAITDLGNYGRALRFYYLRRGLYFEGSEMVKLIRERLKPRQGFEERPRIKQLQGPFALWEGVFFYVLGDIIKAGDLLRLALDLFADQERATSYTPKDRSDAYHMSGQVEHSLGNFQDALNAFQQAEKLELALGNMAYAAKSTAFIGILDKELGAFEEAEKQLESCIPVLKENRDYFYSAMALGNLVQVRTFLGKPISDIALKLRANLEGSRILKSPFAEANTLLYLGVLHALLDDQDLKKALKYIKESLEIFSRISASINMSRVLFWQAFLNLRAGQILLARNMFLNSLQLSATYGLLPLVIDSLVGLVLVNKQLLRPILTLEKEGQILTAAAAHPATTAQTLLRIQKLQDEFEGQLTAASQTSLENLVSEILPGSNLTSGPNP